MKKKTNKKKVILFDSWTKGHIHIIRLLEQFDIHNIDIKLVHVGSWGDEPGRPNREIIKGLKVADIRGYKNLEDVIVNEKPDLVLFLSLDPIIHRAFNLYCQKFKIPTVNLYHGVHSVFQSLSADNKHIGKYLYSLTKKIVNSLWYSLFIYIVALIRTKANWRLWLELFSSIYKKVFGIAIRKAYKDAVTTFICVFNVFDEKQAIKKFSIPQNRVKIVGSPDILKFSGLEDAICNYTNEESFLNKSVIYIGTGERGTKMILSNDKDYFEYLLNTYRALKKHNKKLILKLHYSRVNTIKNLFKKIGSDVTFCENNDFVEDLKKSCGAIVEPSTAALVPLLMGKPIFLTRYNALSDLKFGSILSLYPKAKPIDQIKDFCMLTKPIIHDERITNQWIKSVAGPLPAKKMPCRVVQLINAAINDKTL